MKKIIIGVCLLVCVFTGTQSKSNRYSPMGEVLDPGMFSLLVMDDTLPKADTMWTSVQRFNKGCDGFFSIGFDLDALNSAVTGIIIMRQGHEKNNLPKYTTIFTYSAAIDTILDISGSVEPFIYVQFGFSNTSTTDSIYIDNVTFYGTGY